MTACNRGIALFICTVVTTACASGTSRTAPEPTHTPPRTVDRATDADAPRGAFKGYELYSWQDPGGEWRYALLEGTNRLKSASEIRDATIPEEELLLRLADLPTGETVTWCPPVELETEAPLEAPPEVVVARIAGRARARGVHLQLCVAPGSRPTTPIPPSAISS